MKKGVTILVITAMLLTPQMVFVKPAKAETLAPSQDAFWDATGKFLNYSDGEFGTVNFVGRAGNGSGLGDQKSAIQFDLTNIIGNVTSAKLRIYVTSVVDNDGNASTKPTVTLYGSTDDNWSDNANANSFPQNVSDQVIGTANDNQLSMGGWKEFTVTEFVQAQMSSNFVPSGSDLAKIVTFALRGNETDYNHYFAFASDNEGDATKRPQLVLTLGPAAAKQPVVSSATTAEETKSTAGLVIAPNASETATVTYYKIDGILGGRLYKKDGTEIVDGSFITKDEGAAGLEFMPNTDAHSPGNTFTFNVYAATDGSGAGLSGATQATINVSEVNDKPVPTPDTLSDIAEGSGVRTISFEDLVGNDLEGAPNESGQTLIVESVTSGNGGTVEKVGTNVIFTPNVGYTGPADFQYTVVDNGTTNGALSPQTSEASATVSFNIQPKADAPTVTQGATLEDTLSANGLVIAPTSSGGSTTTHFKITEITGGTLYQKNGTTPITNESFITVSEGGEGLRFLPNANAYGTTGFGFKVQAATSDTDTTLLSDPVSASIIVYEANDAPQVVDAELTYPDIEEDFGERRIKIADLLGNVTPGENESDQTLTLTTPFSNVVGGTVAIDGEDVVFTSNPNFAGTASFDYTVEDNGTTNGTDDPLTATAKVSFEVTPRADQPSVTGTTTEEDTLSSNGLLITPHAHDGEEVKYFRITGITGGTLYMNDGVTALQDDDYIPVSEGAKGLKFKPNKDANTASQDEFKFYVESALDMSGNTLSEEAEVNITVTEVNDAPDAVDDNRAVEPEDSGDITIPIADLLGNDSKGATNESGQELTFTLTGMQNGGSATIVGDNVIFTPDANFTGTASFEYQIEDNGMPSESDLATVTIPIAAQADAPSVTGTTTDEDTLSSLGLVITPDVSDGSDVTHFKITGIKGGTLYQNDGTTLIQNDGLITVSEGAAGLKFKPNQDLNTPGGDEFTFNVQAILAELGTAPSVAVPASITVHEVNDAPVAVNDTLDKVAKGTVKVTIPFSKLTGNDKSETLHEENQTLTVTDVYGATGGSVSLVNGNVEFVLDPTFTGKAFFTYEMEDNGTTQGVAAPKTSTATVEFDVQDMPVITLNGDNPMFLMLGETFAEPGYGAVDGTDGDLTNQVVVTGTDSVDTSQLGTYELKYNVTDSHSNQAAEVTRKVHVVSNDLTGLTVQGNTLTPAFDPIHSNYTLNVPSNVTSLSLAANAFDPTATITINGQEKASGAAHNLNLLVGKNTITIIVTAQGGTTKTYTLEVTRQNAPVTIPGSNGGGNGNGNGNGNTRQAKVVTGDPNQPVVQVDITRTNGNNGNIIDSVAMNDVKADEVVAKAAATNQTVATIIIDDLPEQPADEVTVNVPKTALDKLEKANLQLVIEASGAKITLSADTLDQLGADGDDLYFHVVPVRKPDAKQEVQDRVSQAGELKQYADGRNVVTVGQPMTIDTNYTSRKTKVMFPLTGIEIPADPKQREKFLNGLAIFIEHSDGEKKVQKGTLVFDATGKPIGYEIDLMKFSTFTFISTEDLKTYVHYISGYPDGTFHPSADVTRAELAFMVASHMDAMTDANAGQYPDVSPSHWASEAILELQTAGILVGDDKGNFRPEKAMTRAELAVLIAKLKGLDLSVATDLPADAQGHWAAAAIAAVTKAGLMVGYEDGTFQPNATLSRAEAVTVINRLFDRPVLNDTQQATWPDVPLTHWAASSIESASNDLRAYADGRIEKAPQQ